MMYAIYSIDLYDVCYIFYELYDAFYIFYRSIYTMYDIHVIDL